MLTKHTLSAFPVFLIAIFASHLASQLSAQEQKSRVWKSNSGKFSVEATFEKVDGDNVYLRNKENKQLKVQLSKLSDADKSLSLIHI